MASFHLQCEWFVHQLVNLILTSSNLDIVVGSNPTGSKLFFFFFFFFLPRVCGRGLGSWMTIFFAVGCLIDN